MKRFLTGSTIILAGLFTCAGLAHSREPRQVMVRFDPNAVITEHPSRAGAMCIISEGRDVICAPVTNMVEGALSTGTPL